VDRGRDMRVGVSPVPIMWTVVWVYVGLDGVFVDDDLFSAQGFSNESIIDARFCIALCNCSLLFSGWS